MFCPGPTSRVLRDTTHAVRVDFFSRVKYNSLQVIATFCKALNESKLYDSNNNRNMDKIEAYFGMSS